MPTAEGTIAFWGHPQRSDGFTDALPVRFPPLTHDGLTLEARKDPDRMVVVIYVDCRRERSRSDRRSRHAIRVACTSPLPGAPRPSSCS